MRAPVRLVGDAAVEDIGERVLDALARGMVLYRRRVTAGKGIEGRKLSQTWIIVKPYVVSGLVVRLDEDEETDAVNRVGRLRYGLRPADVPTRLLRQVAHDVHWLGPRGLERLRTAGRTISIDLWRELRPSSINRAPGHDGGRGEDVGPGVDPEHALSSLTRGDRTVVAALLEGLHLVDADDTIDADGRRSERRTWRPLRPLLDEGDRIVGYGSDARVARYTNNAGRNGFSPRTFAAISPLLEDVGYEPTGEEFGRAYGLSEEWRPRLIEILGWVPETAESAGSEDDGPTGTVDVPTPRQDAIIAMLEGRPFQAESADPSFAEVAQAIAVHHADRSRCAALIETALTRVGSLPGRESRSPRRWWRR